MKITTIAAAITTAAALSLGTAATAATAATAGPGANATTTAVAFHNGSAGIEVRDGYRNILGCYQTVGNTVKVGHCNFGLAAQRYNIVLIAGAGGGAWKAEITQGGHYFDMGPGSQAVVRMSTYSANSILRLYDNGKGLGYIERFGGRVPATNYGAGSTVFAGLSGDDDVAFNNFFS